MRRAVTAHPFLAIAIAAVLVGGGFETLQAATGLGGHQLETVADKYVYTALELIAVAVCAARVVRRREDRLAWGLMTFALIAWTGGDLVWTLWLDGVTNPPYPSIADVLYLAMYPAVYVAMMLLIRARLRNAGAAQWLDGGVVGLTIASVAAALVFDSVLAAGSSQLTREIVNIAYPLGDFVLLIFVAVAYSLADWRPGRTWLMLGAGITVMAAADIIFSYQTATATYVPGTLLDVLWPLSMVLLAVAAWMPIARTGQEQVDAPHTIALTLFGATCALALLVVAAFETITPLAVALAAGALVLASVRAALTYMENVRILRRSALEAITDPLSGLGNRRRLMGDLAVAFDPARSQEGSTLLFFDLNGFKRYNDTFGHAAGDALLARIGARLREAIGDHGCAYRLGGDEFCVLLHGRLDRTDPLVGAATEALFERGTGFAVTSSIGVAVLPDDAPSASAALALADERMYADKASRSSTGRAQARDVLMALLSERAHGLSGRVGGVGTLASVVASRLDMVGEQLDEVQRAAELHDIGKLAIPDEILHKAGPLTESEWRFVRQHPVIGERILGAAPALRPVARLVRSTHERWDGKGYPDGISGIRIPLGARIVAVCDAYDAMISRRPYRTALTETEALAELRRCAGAQFDPRVVETVCAALGAAETEAPARFVAGARRLRT
jgi:diguanylate cyclase (GGDEF)-like protein